VEAIVAVDLVSVDEFESVLVAVEVLLVVELLLVVEELLLVLLSVVGELVIEL
jgi:hypothetical protein